MARGHRRCPGRGPGAHRAGDVDPVAIREVSRALWDTTPFYCPECGLYYCSRDRDASVLFDEGLCDRTIGTCPNGHGHLLG